MRARTYSGPATWNITRAAVTARAPGIRPRPGACRRAWCGRTPLPGGFAPGGANAARRGGKPGVESPGGKCGASPFILYHLIAHWYELWNSSAVLGRVQEGL